MPADATHCRHTRITARTPPPFLKVFGGRPKGGFRPKIKKGGLEEERGGSVKKGGVQRFCS